MTRERKIKSEVMFGTLSKSEELSDFSSEDLKRYSYMYVLDDDFFIMFPKLNIFKKRKYKNLLNKEIMATHDDLLDLKQRIKNLTEEKARLVANFENAIKESEKNKYLILIEHVTGRLLEVIKVELITTEKQKILLGMYLV